MTFHLIEEIPDVRLAHFGIHAPTPGHAYLALTTILREMPAVDAARLRAEYESVRQSWIGASGKEGPGLVISQILFTDLKGDAALPGHGGFTLMPMPDRACVQAVSIITRPGEAFGRVIVYRVWNIDGGRQWALLRSQPRSADRS